MNKFYLNILFYRLSFLGMAKAIAHDIEVANADGVTIYYNYTNDGTELEVTSRGTSFSSYTDRHSGSVVIPETITYDDKTYSVTFIGMRAFRNCSRLTGTLTIPASVISSFAIASK